MQVKLWAVVIAFPLSIGPALAGDSDVSESLPFGQVRSIDAFHSGSSQDAGAFSMSAEYASKQGNYEQAIALCQKALRVNPDDIDVHKGYAEILEKKLRKQVHKDP